MITKLIKVITGELYIAEKKGKSVVLSDGSTWNSRNFHQCLGVAKAMYYREQNMDPEVQEARALLARHKQEEVDKAHEAYLKAIRGLSADRYYDLITFALPVGKYKGQSVCSVARHDRQYLDWFFSTTQYRFQDAFKASEPGND